MVDRIYKTANDIVYAASKTGYFGKACKRMVELLTSICSYLTIDSVETDSNSTYNAYLKWAGYDGYFSAYNNSSTAYFCVCDNKKAQILKCDISLYAYEDPAIDGGYSVPVNVAFTSIGGFLNTITLGCNDISGAMSFNWFDSSCIGRVYTLSSNKDYNTSNGKPIVYIASTLYIKQDSFEHGELYWENISPSGYYFSNDDGKNVLIPVGFAGRINGKRENLGVIKWGGKYALYVMRKNNDKVAIDPSLTYNVNGNIYKGCGTELYIPAIVKGMDEIELN